MPKRFLLRPHPVSWSSSRSLSVFIFSIFTTFVAGLLLIFGWAFSLSKITENGSRAVDSREGNGFLYSSATVRSTVLITKGVGVVAAGPEDELAERRRPNTLRRLGFGGTHGPVFVVAGGIKVGGSVDVEGVSSVSSLLSL